MTAYEIASALQLDPRLMATLLSALHKAGLLAIQAKLMAPGRGRPSFDWGNLESIVLDIKNRRIQCNLGTTNEPQSTMP